MIGLGAAKFTVLAYDLLHSNLEIKYFHPVLPTSCFGFFTFYSRPSSHLLHEPQLSLGTLADRQCLWERHCREAPSCQGRATGMELAGQTQPHPKEKTPMATFLGTPGDDNHTGTAQGDNMVGLAGNDTLNGLGGEDTLSGG